MTVYTDAMLLPPRDGAMRIVGVNAPLGCPSLVPAPAMPEYRPSATVAYLHTKQFLREFDGRDVRELPLVPHRSGLMCFDWGPGRWPQA